MMNTMNALMKLPLLAIGCLLGACATGPTQTELNFGESVRQMIRAQTNDPSTLSSPSSAAVDGADGQMLESVLEVYRSEVSSTEAVGEEIMISVGGDR